MNEGQTGDHDFGRIEQTGPASFKASDTIIKSVSSARAIYASLRQKHLKRINLYTEIEGLVQGNPPYNPQDLRDAGLQHISNFNDMSARAIIERACLAYWNLHHNAEYIVNIVLNYPGNPPEAVHWAREMSRHWDYAVKTQWPSYYVNTSSLEMQLVKFGISPILFPDERDPRWRVVQMHKFFVPDQAQADLDLLTTVMVETEFTIQYLWSVLQEFKDASKDSSPWNIKELGRLLAHVTLSSNKESSSNDVFDIERRILSGDISFDSMYNDTLRIISLFQKEYGGKVSHYMFHRHYDDGEFMFMQEEQYEDMREALVIFTMNPGEHTLHANRGLGHKIFSLAQAKIQTDCSVVDMVKWSSTPIIKSPSLATKDADQIRFYPGVPTNIGNAEFVQNNLGSNVQNVVTAAQYLAQLIQFNISYSGADSGSPDPDAGSISPDQARLMAFREFSVLKNNIMHFYATQDCVVQNMTAKMIRSKAGYPGYDIAECWRDRCRDAGIPDEIFDYKRVKNGWKLPRHMEVYATRVAGAGSQVALIIALREMQAMVGSFGPREEREFKRLMITGTIGPEYIGAFLQESDQVDEISGGASVAGLENVVMQSGKGVIFSRDNEHRSHMTVHMALARQVIDGLQQQQMDVIEADSVFNVLVPHMGEHMNALASSMFAQQFVAQIEGPYKEVERYATLNRKNAARAAQAKLKEQQQQAAKQQQVMTEEELKTMQVLNDEERKDLKINAQIARQEKAGEAKERALERKTDVDVAIKAKKADVDIETARKKNNFENTAQEELEADPSGYIRRINGTSPAPYNLEGE